MRIKAKLLQHLVIAFLLFLIVLGIVLGFLYVKLDRSESIGVQVLRLMYCYNDVETDLIDNYRTLYPVLNPDDWEKLSIDNEFRVISAYYKLKGDKTDIEIVREYPGCIIYRILNDNVSADDLWVFEYEVRDKMVCNIREYAMARMCIGNTGVLK